MKARVSWFALLFGLGLAACGGDEPAVTPGGQVTAGTGAAASGSPALTAGAAAAGSGGLSAGAGTGAVAGTSAAAGTGAGAAGTAATVSCGTMTCTAAPANPGLSKTPPVACCVDSAMSICGNIVSGTCTPPLPLAPNCPMIAFSTARTCCVAATNTCGIDASAYGMGCLDVSAAMGGLKNSCDGPGAGAAGGGATAGAGGAAAGASGAAAGAGGARAGAGGASAGAGGR